MSERFFYCVLHHGTESYVEFRADPEDVGKMAQAVSDGATIVLEVEKSIRVFPAHSVHYIYGGYTHDYGIKKIPPAAITYYRKAK